MDIVDTFRLRLRVPEASDATDHIISIIQPESLSSVRVAEKIGERFERADTANGTSVHIYAIRRAAAPLAAI
jgi:hypothetical protein